MANVLISAATGGELATNGACNSEGKVMISWQCPKLGKYLQVRRISYFGALRVFHISTGPLFQTKLQSLCIFLLTGFQSPRELWNPLSKALPSKLDGPGGHSKCNCLQDRVIEFLTGSFFLILIIIRIKSIALSKRRWFSGFVPSRRPIISDRYRAILLRMLLK